MLVIDRQFVEPNELRVGAHVLRVRRADPRRYRPHLRARSSARSCSGSSIRAAQSFLRQAIDHDFLGASHVFEPKEVGPVRFVLVGLLIMLLVIFRPQGILGSREEVMIGD